MAIFASFVHAPSSFGANGNGFILTGAPGSGKTNLVRCLEISGEFVVHEAARDVFEFQRLALGTPTPWLRPDAQEHVTRLQLAREARAPRRSTYFMDRSVIDGAAYSLLRQHPPTEAAKDLIARADVKRYNRRVFLMEQAPHFNLDGKINLDENAGQIEEALVLVYTRLGFELVRVPWGPIQERCDFIRAEAAKPSAPLKWSRVRGSLKSREYLNWSCDLSLTNDSGQP